MEGRGRSLVPLRSPPPTLLLWKIGDDSESCRCCERPFPVCDSPAGEDTTLWYLHDAVLLPPASCFEMFVDERDTTDSLLSFPFTPFFFLLYFKPSNRQISLTLRRHLQTSVVLCIAHPENPHPLERSEGRRGSHRDFCLFCSVFY